MSGYAIVMGSCYGCGSIFTFNPNKVPSVIVKGVREPICQSCVDRANPERIKNGLEPIVPLPGAYDPEPEENVW